jgi:hypothetical protein
MQIQELVNKVSWQARGAVFVMAMFKLDNFNKK